MVGAMAGLDGISGSMRASHFCIKGESGLWEQPCKQGAHFRWLQLGQHSRRTLKWVLGRRRVGGIAGVFGGTSECQVGAERGKCIHNPPWLSTGAPSRTEIHF